MKRAAVLVPLQVTDAGERLVVLIRRGADGDQHPGQIAFPGGRYEPDRDEDLWAAALREAEEEIGLARADVTLLGTLRERRTLSSNFLVSPFVGKVPWPYAFRPGAREVAAVLSVPLLRFAPVERRDRLLWRYAGRTFEVPGVSVGLDLVWGLTLDILDEFILSGF